MAFDKIVKLELTQEEALLVHEVLHDGLKYITQSEWKMCQEIRNRIGAEMPEEAKELSWTR